MHRTCGHPGCTVPLRSLSRAASITSAGGPATAARRTSTTAAALRNPPPSGARGWSDGDHDTRPHCHLDPTRRHRLEGASSTPAHRGTHALEDHERSRWPSSADCVDAAPDQLDLIGEGACRSSGGASVVASLLARTSSPTSRFSELQAPTARTTNLFAIKGRPSDSGPRPWCRNARAHPLRPGCSPPREAGDDLLHLVEIEHGRSS